MQKIFIIAALVVAACSCKKKSDSPAVTPPQEMLYTNLNNVEAGQQQPRSVDADGDGVTDINVTVLAVLDPIAGADKYKFNVSGAAHTDFPVNASDSMPILQQGASIGNFAFPNYSWVSAATVLLAQKTVTSPPPAVWSGPWKDKSNVYFAFRILKNNRFYYGWCQISFNTTTEKVILHKVAVSKVDGGVVKAGM